MQQLSYDGAYPDVISFDPGTKFQNSLPQWIVLENRVEMLPHLKTDKASRCSSPLNGDSNVRNAWERGQRCRVRCQEVDAGRNGASRFYVSQSTSSRGSFGYRVLIVIQPCIRFRRLCYSSQLLHTSFLQIFLLWHSVRFLLWCLIFKRYYLYLYYLLSRTLK